MARKDVLENLSIRKRCFIDIGYIKWFNIWGFWIVVSEWVCRLVYFQGYKY